MQLYSVSAEVVSFPDHFSPHGNFSRVAKNGLALRIKDRGGRVWARAHIPTELGGNAIIMHYAHVRCVLLVAPFTFRQVSYSSKTQNSTAICNQQF